MANRIPSSALADIEKAIGLQTGSIGAPDISRALQTPVPERTLQYRLKRLVTDNRIVMEGGGRWAKYRLANPLLRAVPLGDSRAFPLVLSEAARHVREYVRRRPEARLPVGYNRSFLDEYRPNTTWYLTKAERAHLALIGKPLASGQPAGTYAKKILSRLLIDLSWNSSRLEGNTYSLLDTKRLIEFGEEADGRASLEAQMILNHKDAIEFLVNGAEDSGFNRYTILNLHALLANNLLADPSAAGRLRYIAVGIEQSTFHPLEVPQLIEEAFDQILNTAEAVSDPFEQALFVMTHIPYLQPFDDVNKRVSRLAANIPLIKANLAPLSFTEVPRQVYTEAVLGVYELNNVSLLKEIFLWTYERSAARYSAMRQSLGDPDPFRLRYRADLRGAVAEVIRAKAGRKEAALRVEAWAAGKIGAADRHRFVESARDELTGLHEGNFARYQVRPAEFEAWRKVWQTT